MSVKKGQTQEKWSYIVELETNSEIEADNWWLEKDGTARVYYSNGNIRNAK
mgnify:CR=1 FL=1